jgi:hypothetical protein
VASYPAADVACALYTVTAAVVKDACSRVKTANDKGLTLRIAVRLEDWDVDMSSVVDSQGLSERE